MSRRAKNSPIGTVDCPYKGCPERCKVFKFRPRTEGRKSVFTDKHYAECPKHGRLGSDGNPAATEYILDNAIIWGPANPAPVPEKSGAAAHAAAPQNRRVPEQGPGAAPKRAAPAPEPTPKPAPKWYEPLI